MTRFQVIVIGLGAMGSATCWQLARRGVKVLGLERFDIPHAMGSSHGFSRMTRLAYYEHPDYVPLLKSAHRLWYELESQTGRKLIYLTGGLYMGPVGGSLLDGSLRVGARCTTFHSNCSTARNCTWRLRAISSARGFRRHARAPRRIYPVGSRDRLTSRSGDAPRAELHGHEPVTGWKADGGGFVVTTPRGSYMADQLIFCGGAWTDKLVRDLGVPLTVTRQVLGWVWPKKPELFELARLPVWAIDNPDGSIHYGFPMMRESPGFKLAHHTPAAITNPDTVDRNEQAGDEQTFRPVLQRFIPDADGPLLSLRTCMYTNSPDHHFIVDRHPGHEGIFLACGFSGHGFKFAPLIGHALADLAIGGKTSLPIEFFGDKSLSSKLKVSGCGYLSFAGVRRTPFFVTQDDKAGFYEPRRETGDLKSSVTAAIWRNFELVLFPI